MMNGLRRLDREKLLPALRGQKRARNVKPAWCQELSESYSGQLCELCVEGLKPIPIPIPYQALNSLRAISKQVPDSASWWIEARRVTLKSKSSYPFVDTLSVFMKNAVLQLGLDPDYHSVTLKPHKLLIFEPGRRATNGKLTFENHPSDAFGVLMLQIPVEGGHCGGDLTIRSKFGVTKLDRSRENGKKFYLSASFLDCVHELSPVTEGYSLALTFHLIWKNPLVVTPHRLDLPAFISSLNTVQEILKPLLSPEENCDTELLVIPLTNDYAKIPLSYDTLRGTDKLMANLLQSTNAFEIRLATIVNYRAGTAYDERRMNTIREEEDDGFPESPLELGLKDFPPVKGKRLIDEVREESCSIEDVFLLDGTVDRNRTFPIHWERDYIFKNIDSIKGLFDVTFPPDKEKFDRYHDRGSNLELRQWWYKPILILWPKNSTAIECRKDFNTVLRNLEVQLSRQPNLLDSEADHMALLSKFRKILNYHYRHGISNDVDDYEVDDEGQVTTEDIPILFTICNLLKAKEEGTSLCRYYSQNSHLTVDLSVFHVLTELAVFVGFAGWDACREFFASLLISNDLNCLLGQTIPVAFELLQVNSPLRNEAAVQVFQQLYITLFPPDEILSIELLNAKFHFLRSLPNDCYVLFLLIIFILEHRNLIHNADLVVWSTSHLSTPPIDRKSLNLFVSYLCESPLVLNSSFEQLSVKLQDLLSSLCSLFLIFDVYTIRSDFVAFWIKLIVFIGHPSLVQQMMDKILARPSFSSEQADKMLLDNLQNLLSKEQLKDQKLKTVRGQLKSRYQVLVKRSRYEIRQKVSYMKKRVSTLNLPSHPFSRVPTDPNQLRLAKIDQLPKILILRSRKLDGIRNLPPEETEEEFLSHCDLIELCNKLESKEYGLGSILCYIVRPPIFPKSIWLRSELLSAIAGFIAFVGWTEFSSCFDFIRHLLGATTDKLKFMICLTKELLQRNRIFGDEAAATVFKHFSSFIRFTSKGFNVGSQEFNLEIARRLSLLDEQHRVVFYQVVLLMESRHQLDIEDCEGIVEAGIHCLCESPISTLHLFVKSLFDKSSIITALPFNELTLRCRNTLKDLCNKFVHHLPSHLNSVATTDHLLNWIRLIIYTDKTHLEFFMCNLCVQRNSDDIQNLFLLNMLATEDFRNESVFKIVREHPILTEWKRQQEKESFVKLFTPRTRHKSSTTKRKMPAEDLLVIHCDRKRAKVDDSDVEE